MDGEEARLTLEDLSDPRELTGLDQTSGLEGIRELELGLLSVRPEPERLAALLASTGLAELRGLSLSTEAPLPSCVMEALVGMKQLHSLALLGRSVLEPQVERLSCAEGLAGLRCLALLVDRYLSPGAFAALARATFAPGLEQLMGFGLCADSLTALLDAPWPSLRMLSLGNVLVSARAEDRLAALRARGVTVQVVPGGDLRPAPAHAERATRVRVLLGGAPSPDAFVAIMELLAGFDDERYELELRAECEAALARWPAPTVAVARLGRDQSLDRPCGQLVRCPAVWFDAPGLRGLKGPGLAFEEISVHAWSLPRGQQVDLSNRFPNLRRIVVKEGREGAKSPQMRAWRLPRTLVELDLEAVAWFWVDERKDLGTLAQVVGEVCPGVHRVHLGAGWWTLPKFQHEVLSETGGRLENGWLIL